MIHQSTRSPQEMGIDLGTTNTVVFVNGQGIVLQEPSVVALDQETGKILSAGQEAKRMMGRTPDNIRVVRPVKGGAITDFDPAQAMLQYFLRKVRDVHRLRHPRVVIGIPSRATDVEVQAVKNAVKYGSAREYLVVENTMAAAIGSGLPVNAPVGSMIVDIGGGTSEMAVISFEGIVASQSIRVAGDEMNDAIINHIKKTYRMMIGESTAEEIKRTIGSADPPDHEETVDVRGCDAITGLPKISTVRSTEIHRALWKSVHAIVDSIQTTLEKSPPELVADIMDRGIVLTGGGSLLRHFDRVVSGEIGMPVQYTEDPLLTVARGTSAVLAHHHYLNALRVHHHF
ncbi:MAG: rod shape-determining protein [Sulfobacillus benefaciens]|uniref:Cell shape-determining protein MreB n=1 Tax=Sulfobacillus benefaciens TaxID=453960 RepID=A0A2T2XE44_9FIRM|nr:MAG: rod shape-determining protein [Sulfobacillus benefaciens]